MSLMKGWTEAIRIITAANGSFDLAINPQVISAPISTSVPIDKLYALESRDPVEIIEDVQDITGTLERYYFSDNESNNIVENGGTNLDLKTVAGVYGDALTDCIMRYALPTNQSGTVLYLHGVKFSDWSVGVAQGDVTTETVSFSARNISTGF